MTNPTMHPLAADYLKQLRRAGRHLPADRLDELYAEVEAHILEATDPDDHEVEVRNVLERLGDPSEIVGAEAPTHPPATSGRGTREWTAIILLPIGGFFLGIGWVVGLIALWSSSRWSTRDKWIGTLLVPGGLATALLYLNLSPGSRTCSGSFVGNGSTSTARLTTEHCTGGVGTLGSVLLVALLCLLVLAPILSASYLARRAR